MDDVGLEAPGEPAERGRNCRAPGERNACGHAERLDRVEAGGRVVLTRRAIAREVDVVAGRSDGSRPAEEVDRAHVPDPEHAKRTVGHGGQL